MKNQDKLILLVFFILGYFLFRYMGNGFSVGGETTNTIKNVFSNLGNTSSEEFPCKISSSSCDKINYTPGPNCPDDYSMITVIQNETDTCSNLCIPTEYVSIAETFSPLPLDDNPKDCKERGYTKCVNTCEVSIDMPEILDKDKITITKYTDEKCKPNIGVCSDNRVYKLFHKSKDKCINTMSKDNHSNCIIKEARDIPSPGPHLTEGSNTCPLPTVQCPSWSKPPAMCPTADGNTVPCPQCGKPMCDCPYQGCKPSCKNGGKCCGGKCVCKIGYSGPNCEISPDQLMCVPSQDKCVTETASECSKKYCNSHGVCQDTIKLPEGHYFPKIDQIGSADDKKWYLWCKGGGAALGHFTNPCVIDGERIFFEERDDAVLNQHDYVCKDNAFYKDDTCFKNIYKGEKSCICDPGWAGESCKIQCKDMGELCTNDRQCCGNMLPFDIHGVQIPLDGKCVSVDGLNMCMPQFPV